MKKKQKEVFLKNEGNAWFERNHKKQEFDLKDPIIQAISKCLEGKSTKKKIFIRNRLWRSKKITLDIRKF